jgi:hypothetical protein
VVEEVADLFHADGYGVKAAVDLSSPQALSALGGGANGEVMIWQISRCFNHVRPANEFVPTAIEQVLDPRVVAGTLDVL